MTDHRLKRYRLYVDESGDHTYRYLDKPEKRYLGLTCAIFELDEYNSKFRSELEELKAKHFRYDPDDPPIFHRNDIINKRRWFGVLNNPEKEKAFNDDLLKLFSDNKYTLITVVIDKKVHIERYGQAAFHPYHYCLSVMMERYCGLLRFHNAVGDIIGESRGGTEDKQLKLAYRDVYDSGTQWRKPDFFRTTLTSRKIKIKPKVLNIAGLQLADLLAYPIKQEILIENRRVSEPGEVFGKKICEVVQSKHNRRYDTNRVEGYGKIFLK